MSSERVLDFDGGIFGDHVRWNAHRSMGGGGVASEAKELFLSASGHPYRNEPASPAGGLAIRACGRV